MGTTLRGSPPPNPALDPIARLVAALDEHSERGQDTPRLYAIQPPLEPTCIYERGERLRFGISLFAWAIDLYPYIVLAVKQAERMGIGKHSLGANGEARPTPHERFKLVGLSAANGITGQTQDIPLAPLAGDITQLQIPDVPVTHAQITSDWSGLGVRPEQTINRLQLRFFTPVTLRQRGELLRVPTFSVLIHRLLERLHELNRVSLTVPLPCLPATRDARNALLAQADAVQLLRNDTRWVTLHGYSSKRAAPTDLSGLMGSATYTCADFAPFMPLLRWGEVIHIGQHAVKGNGWYRLIIA